MNSLRQSIFPMTEHVPDQMPRKWLEAVHCPLYVDQVCQGKVPLAIERRIGFPITKKISKRASYTCGGTWLAAKLALAAARELFDKIGYSTKTTSTFLSFLWILKIFCITDLQYPQL